MCRVECSVGTRNKMKYFQCINDNRLREGKSDTQRRSGKVNAGKDIIQYVI